MAYVRRTEQLVEHVAQKVQKMHRAAEAMYSSTNVEIGTPIYNSMREAALTVAWLAAPQLRETMPRSWTREHTSLQVRLLDDNSRRVASLMLTATETNPFIVPPARDQRSYSYEVAVPYEHQDAVVRKWVDDEAERDAKRRELKEQYNTVENQLVMFLRSHASLNAALKEMPEIELYIPDEYMNKVRAKSEAREKKERESIVEEIGIDRNQLASIGIAHRIATAGQ